MGNNIKTKNLIYGFRTYDSLPYQHSKMIDYSSNSNKFAASSTSLNNTYAQCVDNDMYILKQLKSMKDGSRLAGPLVAASDAEIAALPDGAKFFESTFSSTVMQKRVKTLSETVVKSSNISDIEIIQPIGLYAAMVCAPDTTYMMFVDGINSSENGNLPRDEVKDDYSPAHKVCITAVMRDGPFKELYFGGRVGATRGIYKLHMPDQKSISGCKLSLAAQVDGISDDIICMSFDQQSSRLLFATKSVLYSCIASNASISNIKILHSFSTASDSGFICAIEARADNAIVFTRSGRVYVVSYERSKLGFSNAEEIMTSEDSSIAYDVLDAGNGYIYAATSNGICTLAGDDAGSLWPIDSRYHAPVHNIAFDGTNVWCADEDGNIFRIVHRELELYSHIDGQTILGIYIINGVKIISTQDGIKYERSHGEFVLISSQDNTYQLDYASSLVIQKSPNIYAATLNEGNYDVHNIQLTTTTGGFDYTYADEVTTKSFSDISQVVGLAWLGNTPYSLVNVYDAAGKFVKSQMFSISSSSGSISTSEFRQYNSSYLSYPIKGFIQAGNDTLYVATSGRTIKFQISGGSISDSSTADTAFASYAIIDSQPIVGSSKQFAVTLYDNDYWLAKVEVDGSKMTIVEKNIALGIESNVVEVGRQYVVLEKDGSAIKAAAYGLSNSMTPTDVASNSMLSDLYDSTQCYLVNNFYTQIRGTTMYRRADYLVPYDTSKNISAVQSFLSVDVDEDNNMLGRNVYVEDLDVKNVANIRYSIDGSNIVCYSKTDDNIVTYAYVEKGVDFNELRILHPKAIFDGTSGVELETAAGTRQAIIESTSYDSASPYNLSFSAIEITTSDTIRRRSFTNGESVLTGLTEISGLDSGYVPMALLRAKDKTYVVAQNTDAQDTEKNCRMYSISNDDTTMSVFKSFDHTYGEFKQIAISYGSSDEYDYDDSPDTLTIASFDEYSVPFNEDTDNDQYEYVQANITGASVNAGVIYVVFSNYTIAIDLNVDGYPVSVFSWNGSAAKLVSSMKQVADERCNLTFPKCIFQQDVAEDVLYLLNGSTVFNKLDPDVTFVKQSSCPQSSIFNDNTRQIGKDAALNCIYAISDANIVSLLKDNTITSISISVPAGKSIKDIYPVECYNKSFDEQKNVIYSIPENDSSSLSQVYIKKADGSATALCTARGQLRVINNDEKYPIAAYANCLFTVKYANQNTVTAAVQKTKHVNAGYSSSIAAFVLDARDNSKVHLAFDSQGLKVYSMNMNDNGSPALFKSINDARYIFYPHNQASFPNAQYAFAYDQRGYSCIMNTTDGAAALSVIDSSSNTTELMNYSTIGYLDYSNARYAAYGVTNPSAGASKAFKLVFSGYGQVPSVVEKHSTASSAGAALSSNIAHDILQAEDGSYVVQTTGGLYQYAKIGDDEKVNSSPIYSTTACIGLLQEVPGANSTTYYMSYGNAILSSKSLSSWSTKNAIIASLSVSSDGKQHFASDVAVDNFALLSPYVSLAHQDTGSNAGLYFTRYQYETFKNTSDFSPESAFYAYYDNFNAISSICQDGIDEHVLNSHNTSSLVTLVNSYMGTSFPLSGFIDVKSQQYDIQNDYIEYVLTGSPTNDNVVAFAANSANNGAWQQVNCSYIAKCWKSGLTELYVYLPTTYTYYIPHLEGAGQCDAYGNTVVVNGKNMAAQMQDNATSVRLNIVSSYFTIENIIENTIKGNSLPLRIYKDTEYEDTCEAGMFHSFICPSVASQLNNEDSFLGYYALKYYCFGSDAQAIKLSFFNPSPRYSKKHKTVIYHANGGFMQKLPGMKSIKQRIYEGDEPAAMYWDIFERDGAFFIGWSKEKNAVDGDDSYYDGLSFSYDNMSSSTLNLYAVWITYKFGPNDTQMSIANASPMDYTIAEITIDPSASIPNNPSLGNTLVVEYGD